jgi:hypothetical protein
MKTTKLLIVLLVLILIFGSFSACSNTNGTDGSSNIGNKQTMDGTYKCEDGYSATTFIIEGTKITCILDDYYYHNTFTTEGTLEIVEGEESLTYKLIWVDSEQGTPAFRTFTYDPKAQTITTASSFNTYVLHKQG